MNDNIEQFPGTQATLELEELTTLLTKAETLLGTQRFRINLVGTMTQADSEVLASALTALEKALTKATIAKGVLELDRRNRQVLNEAREAKVELESAVVEAENLL